MMSKKKADRFLGTFRPGQAQRDVTEAPCFWPQPYGIVEILRNGSAHFVARYMCPHFVATEDEAIKLVKKYTVATHGKCFYAVVDMRGIGPAEIPLLSD